MTGDAILTVTFFGYWHCGTGRGIAAALDAVVARDTAGLPIIPGRTLKGILRDAVATAGKLGHYDKHTDWVLSLFGSSGFTEGANGEFVPDSGTDPGRLQVSSAVVDSEVRDWFLTVYSAGLRDETAEIRKKADRLRATLFETLGQTAINPSTGIAKDHSLRMTEAAVPLMLTSRLSLIPPHPGIPETYNIPSDPDREWVSVLKTALPLVAGIGGDRSRGLGRCRLEIAEMRE